ncbi:YrrS family protein [Bacillus massiliglaciei]|uniref:YrrS family protein n=1 Tax=Bacillus massiliglaciei TaxID=1816693 RepID=UPI000B17EE4E|nr:YrrS family protein [Bacillus massiliglaciei]
MGTRFDRRDKERKVNKVYNIAISVVSVLIVIVALSIILTNKDSGSEKASNEETKQEQTNTDNPKSETQKEVGKGEDPKEDKSEADEEKAEAPDETDNEEKADEDEETTEKSDSLVEIEGSGDSNVKATYSDPAWQPVGTEQTGQHTTSFDKGSTDWNEMSKAIAYGAGINAGTMRIWWLQNGGSPTTAIGTVSDGDNPQTYRVYIEWVDGEGWKPVKVEELRQNDKR